MSERSGLRERKKRERRHCIEQAALQLFDELGFEGTTIDDIAAAADIAPRTFFSYFPTKEDVVLADYAARLERLVDELGRQPTTEPPWVALRKSFVVVAGDYETHRDDLIRRFTIMAANPSVYARNLQLQAGWEDALTEALIRRTGRTAETIEPRLMSSAALACMRSSIRHWLQIDHDTPLPELIDDCFARFATGLAATTTTTTTTTSTTNTSTTNTSTTNTSTDDAG